MFAKLKTHEIHLSRQGAKNESRKNFHFVIQYTLFYAPAAFLHLKWLDRGGGGGGGRARQIDWIVRNKFIKKKNSPRNVAFAVGKTLTDFVGYVFKYSSWMVKLKYCSIFGSIRQVIWSQKTDACRKYCILSTFPVIWKISTNALEIEYPSPSAHTDIQRHFNNHIVSAYS